jgi:hypothetical protein
MDCDRQKNGMEIVLKWMIWGYPDFRTQAIWFSDHSRFNPNFIINNHYFAALDIFVVAYPV